MNLLPSLEMALKNPRQISKSRILTSNVRLQINMKKRINSIKIGMQIAVIRIARKVINA